MTRETVRVGAKWIKSVSWADSGRKWATKKVTLTSDESQAARFVPEAAAALRQAYGPRAAAQHAARERAVTELLSAALLESLQNIRPELRNEAAAIVKGLF